MLKMPAYGRELLAARRAKRMPARLVLVTDWWQLAQLHRRLVNCFALVCDPLAAPYDFLVLQGLDVVLAHVSDDALGVSVRIARAAPRELTVVSGFDECMRLVGHLEAIVARRTAAAAVCPN